MACVFACALCCALPLIIACPHISAALISVMIAALIAVWVRRCRCLAMMIQASIRICQPVAAIQPAIQINLRASCRAKWPLRLPALLTADRTFSPRAACCHYGLPVFRRLRLHGMRCARTLEPVTGLDMPARILWRRSDGYARIILRIFLSHGVILDVLCAINPARNRFGPRAMRAGFVAGPG